MPKKTVLEMNEWELKHYSLAAKVFHMTLMGSVIVGLVTLLVGLSLYTYSLTGQYIGESYGLARSTAAVVDKAVDVHSVARRVMEIYHSIPEEERQDQESAAYLAHFARITRMQEYQTLYEVLREMHKAGDVNDLYVGVYDRETCALVYVCDPGGDSSIVFEPGQWEPVEQSEIDKYYSWDGKSRLYDASMTSRYGWMCTAGVPVYDGSGSISCFILADVLLGDVADGMKNFVLQYTLALLVVMLIIGYLMTRHMKRELVRPINQIAEAAAQYVHDRQNGVKNSHHFSSLEIRTGDEVENLSLVMAEMERGLLEYEEGLTRITAEKERISTELNLATRIQATMLPSIFPPFPGRNEFDIFASMNPAKEVGGDFFDFFLVDDDHLCLVIADVSGKGVPAALFMMASKIIIANYAKMGHSPAEILANTNDAICSNNQEKMFVTVWLGILEVSTGILTAANAGHEYPALTGSDGRFALYKDRHGFVIGGMSGMKYREYTLQLQPGSKLFVYTDGVPEATNDQTEMFGTDRMLETLNLDPDATPHELLGSMKEAVDTFVGDAEQFDDLTMLCLAYHGKEGSE